MKQSEEKELKKLVVMWRTIARGFDAEFDSALARKAADEAGLHAESSRVYKRCASSLEEVLGDMP